MCFFYAKKFMLFIYICVVTLVMCDSAEGCCVSVINSKMY